MKGSEESAVGEEKSELTKMPSCQVPFLLLAKIASYWWIKVNTTFDVERTRRETNCPAVWYFPSQKSEKRFFVSVSPYHLFFTPLWVQGKKKNRLKYSFIKLNLWRWQASVFDRNRDFANTGNSNGYCIKHWRRRHRYWKKSF